MLKNFIHLVLSFIAFSLAYSIAFLTEIDVVKNAVLYAFIIQWILFVPAYLFKTEKFYDLSGSFTYVFVVSYILYSQFTESGLNVGNIIVGSCIIIWAVRLGTFLFFRIKKAGKDKRFDEIKTSASRFFMTWTLQGMWVSICSACALAAV